MAQAGRGNSSLFGRSQLKKAAPSSKTKKKEDWGPSRKPGQDSGPSGASLKWETGTRLIPRSGNQPGAREEKKSIGLKVGDTVMGKATARFAVNPLKVTGVSNQGARGNVITAVGRDNRTYTFSESDVCRDEQGRFSSC